MKMHILRWRLVVSIILLYTLGGLAQSLDTKIWLTQALRYRLDQGVYFSVSWFQNYQDTSFTYTQLGGSISHRLSKKHNLSVGFKETKSLKSGRKGHRISVGISESFIKIPLNQSIKIEYFYPKTSKYAIRASYTLRGMQQLKWKRFRTKAYGSMQVFYFSGGKDRWLYDEYGEKLLKDAPLGFHRLRLKTGLISRFHKSLYGQVYLMWQQEFNVFKTTKGRINTINPRSGKVKNSYSNYGVLGINVQYRPYFKKKKKRPRKRQAPNPYFDYFNFNYF